MHKQEVGAYHGMQEVLVKLIADAYDLQYLHDICDEFTGFDDVSCHEMLEHLIAKVKLTTTEKAAMRDEIRVEWDQTEDFGANPVSPSPLENQHR